MSLGSIPILLILVADQMRSPPHLAFQLGSSRLGGVVPDWTTAATPATRRMISAAFGAVATHAMRAGELRDLEQDLRQAVGHVDHDVVAARHLVDAPAGGCLELVASGVERRVRIADSADV